MSIEKKPFRIYNLPEDNAREDLSKSIWLNKEMRELIYSVGCMLRQYQLSTLLKQALQIAEAKLIEDQKISDIMYGNGMRNKRKGLDDVQLVEAELSKILGKSHNKN